jgi:hypothetical protein
VYASTWGTNNKKNKQTTCSETLSEERKGHSDIRKEEEHATLSYDKLIGINITEEKIVDK